MSEVKLDETGLTTPSISLGGNTLSSDGDKLLWNGEEFKSADGSGSSGHNVGEQWISMDGTIPFGGLAFLGQTVSKETYIELYNWVEANGRFKTEAEWQSLYTANNGNVAFYAKVDDTSFRLPSFNGYLKPDTTAGGYTKEGLPNITGTVRTGSGSGSTMNGAFRNGAGAFYPNTNSSCTYLMGSGVESTVSGIYAEVNFDASRSSSIYGNSNHVIPETSTILVGVYAFNTIVSESDIELNSIRQRIDELETLSKHAVGEQWISMDGTIPAGGVPFNGQILNIADYQALYNWAKDNGRIKTESEWQTLKTNNNSNVAYYSDYSTTQFRMPLFRGYLKADSGSGYIKQGLPNITGVIDEAYAGYGSWGGTGAFSVANGSTTGTRGGGGGDPTNKDISFNASRSNSIYGASSNVTPETSKMLVGVYAFNTVVNTAILDATSKLTGHILVDAIAIPHIDIGYPYADASGALLALRSVNHTSEPGAFVLFAKDATTQKVLVGKPDGTLTWDGKNVLTENKVVSYVTESVQNEFYGYRIYSDGWKEQYVTVDVTSSGNKTSSWPKAFTKIPYALCSTQGQPTNVTSDNNFVVNIVSVNTTNFTVKYFDSDSAGARVGVVMVYGAGY